MTQEALRTALEALEADPLEMVADANGHMVFFKDKAITAIKEALAQPEQEQENAEQMSRLGWQCFNCPACGSDGAIAFSKPTPAEYAMGYAEGFEDACKPKPEQEPVALVDYSQPNDVCWGTNEDFPDGTPLYAAPQERKPLEPHITQSQAKAIMGMALDLEKTGRLVSLTEGQERSDFVAKNRNIQCALEDYLRCLVEAAPTKDTP